MMGQGKIFRVTLFGSSHGPEVGATIEGVPKGTPIDLALVQQALDRRRPVGRRLATKRQEEDRLIVDAGIADGRASGTPIRAHVANEDVQRGPYEERQTIPRPGHADYPARVRYGPSADLSGGGIFSGRMTVGLVIAGSVAAQMLATRGIEIASFTQALGGQEYPVPDGLTPSEARKRAQANEVGCPDPIIAEEMERVIADARRDGDSVGGIIETVATGLPVGLGEPFFDTLEGELAHAIFAIPAVKGVEFGAGFRAAAMRGSQHNDAFYLEAGSIRTRTNHAGGILGGLATGMPLVFRVGVKPTSSIAKEQESVDLSAHESVRLVVAGRHDPCIVPRAVVVVEAVTASVLLDLMMRGKFYP